MEGFPEENFSPSLVGRERQVKDICGFLATTHRSGALLLSGQPGVGKTALLDAAAETVSAKGTRVVRAAGVEFEADVSYSGLHQLLFPLTEFFGRLDDVHGGALRTALGLDSGPPPDRLVVSSATLLLLRRVAAESRLLLVIDDLPWLDQASAAVLGFVARRLEGSPVGFLGAMRSGSPTLFHRLGLPEYEVPPLDRTASGELLDARFPSLADQVRERLLVVAEGNPLALIELPTALSGQQLAATESLPPLLPLSRRLQALFVSRVSALPDAARRLLLVATLDGTGDLGVLQASAREAGCPAGIEALTPAEEDRLVRFDEGTRRLVFRHPLIRSAVMEACTTAQRRAAHRVLAQVLLDHPERRAWHLGEATVEPDEDVAVLLERSARLISARGNARGAVAALVRSADLSPRGEDRARRLSEAAYIGADATGDLLGVSDLLAHARRADPDLTDSLHSAAAAVYLTINGGGDIDTAHRVLVGAIESGAHRYDARDAALVDAIHLLLLLSFYSGRAELWPPFYAALARLRPEPPPLLAVAGRTFSDPARTGVAALEQLEPLLDSLPQESDPGRIVRIGTASLYADRLADLREPSWRVVLQGRDGGPPRRTIGALMHLCLGDYLSGRWDECDELATEGLRLCEDSGYRFFTWYFWYCRAVVAAARGDDGPAGRLADRISAFATPRGVGTALHYARHVRTLAGIVRGDFEAAYQQAAAVSPPGVFASHVPHALWVAMDLVEAAVRTDRRAEAAAHVRAMADIGMAELSPRLALLAGGSAALCAESDEEAVRLFAEALAVPGVERWPFDLARVRLAYGERLRRARANADCRGQLSQAHDAFALLGAGPWRERAAKELRASGWTAPRTGTAERSVLSPQERQIAELAASGLSNKQIAERLYLSHRTIGAHLYQIFPKLGISSRAALRDALAALDEQDGPDGQDVTGGGFSGRR
ncbi:ATP-binding protein [Actinacidiphila guanduensis]|uniref:Regulatory protein, luxR family n=1 Tax=Actinacidiphila guanduensis TaxID=310781 RepID=A0A1H0FTA4_9ACTN|nr:LuxR family transcriptional regulator [Actinacidiphila guanduensis]SDN97814.1 regulatory protein, luxR family [Actinacidiphila guanduensis]